MPRNLPLLAVFLLFLPASHGFADIAAIRADALPQETAVLAALDDARQLEPYSSSWTVDWKYQVARKDVADRLERDLSFLRLAVKNHPDNSELLLLTGLVAHYAYNVDVPDTHDEAMSAFDQARKLAPIDLRAPWFRASLLCQTKETKSGADEFLAIEDNHAWDQLPAAFWDDYMTCATVTNMPAHVLRAGGYLEKLHAPNAELRTFLIDNARKRFDPFDPNKTYDPKEVWQGADAGQETQFTSTACGVRLEAHGSWAVNQLALNNGSCVAYFSTGPYKAVTGDLHPSILLLIQQAGTNETLQDFLKKFMKNGDFEPFTPSRCPAATCLAMRGVQPGMYKANGDGHGHILVFERDQPEYPGLIFESPQAPPSAEGGGGAQYFRPNQVQQRIPGKLYYLVLVDMAASIEDPAMKDLDFFLQNLTVE